MTTFRLISTKGTEQIIGTLAEAIAAARQMDATLQPAYGVTVEDADTGETVAEIEDDAIDLRDLD